MLKAKEVKKQLPLAVMMMTMMLCIATPAEAYLPGGECAKPLQEQYEQADIAVLGRLESIEGDIGAFKVLRTYKGDVKVGDTIKYKVNLQPEFIRTVDHYDKLGDISKVFIKATPDTDGIYQPSGCWSVYTTACEREMRKCLKHNPFLTREK